MRATKKRHLSVSARVIELVDKVLLWMSRGAADRHVTRGLDRKYNKLCDFAGCQDDAIHWIRWGVDGRQSGNVCHDHMRETWDTCHTQVAAGICIWEQRSAAG